MKVRAVLLCVGVLSGLLPTCSWAQSAGDTVLSLGWVRINQISDSDPLTVTSVGGHLVNQVEPGTGGTGADSNTVGFVLEHYFTDNIGMSTLGGYPSYIDFVGEGSLARYGQLGKARPYAPQVTVRYHFLSAASKFRPFVGLGVSYVWFNGTQITNNSFVTQSFGPGGSARATASSSWNPVFEVGANYRFDKHWAAGFSASYLPASTNITVTGQTATGVEVVTRTNLRLRPVLTFLNVSYIF